MPTFNPFTITETYELIKAIEILAPKSDFLTEAFFPQQSFINSDIAMIELLKEGKKLAAYVSGFKPVAATRQSSTQLLVKPPLMAARRTITMNDIAGRVFGETPIISSKTPEERAIEMQSRDLNELIGMVNRRKEAQASELLQTGAITVTAYDDSGVAGTAETITFNNINPTFTPNPTWDNASAKIFSDLRGLCDGIAEAGGELPNMLVLGKNVEGYLINNKEMKDWLMVPNRQNLSMATFEPKYLYPGVRFIGYLSALGLEVYSYNQTYVNDSGNTVPFIGDDKAVLGVGGRGQQVYGLVSLLSEGAWQSFSASYVPYYFADENVQQSSLTVYSRCLLAPHVVTDFVAINAA